MTDPIDSLRRTRSRFDPPEPAFDRLLDRRRRKRRTTRITSIAMAFAVVSAGIAGALYAFRGTGTTGPGIASRGGQGSTNGPNLVAGPGQYYYSKTEIYFAGSSPPPSRAVGPWTLS